VEKAIIFGLQVFFWFLVFKLLLSKIIFFHFKINSTKNALNIKINLLFKEYSKFVYFKQILIKFRIIWKITDSQQLILHTHALQKDFAVKFGSIQICPHSSSNYGAQWKTVDNHEYSLCSPGVHFKSEYLLARRGSNPNRKLHIYDQSYCLCDTLFAHFLFLWFSTSFLIYTMRER